MSKVSYHVERRRWDKKAADGTFCEHVDEQFLVRTTKGWIRDRKVDIDMETVPAYHSIDMGAVGSSSWRSRLIPIAERLNAQEAGNA